MNKGSSLSGRNCFSKSQMECFISCCTQLNGASGSENSQRRDNAFVYSVIVPEVKTDLHPATNVEVQKCAGKLSFFIDSSTHAWISQ